MGLSYHFKFRAPGSKRPKELVSFLRGVEEEAKRMGYRKWCFEWATWKRESHHLFVTCSSAGAGSYRGTNSKLSARLSTVAATAGQADGFPENLLQ